MNRSQHESKFELLKIISILMVIVLHYFNSRMGGGFGNVNDGTFNNYFMYYVESLSIIAVNCFIMITGYFLIVKESIRFRKVTNLVVITVFYGILFLVINGIINNQVGSNWFNLDTLSHAISPVYDAKWFVGSYIALYLLTPYINKVLKSLTKKQYLRFLVIYIILFSITPTIFYYISYNDRGYGVLSFIMFYAIGGYLRKYPLKVNKKWLFLLGYLFSTTITFVLALKVIGHGSFFSYNTIFNVMSTFFLFMFFSNIKIKSRIINYLAGFTFPIYLIHTDISIRNYVYNNILETHRFWNSGLLYIGHLIITVVITFIVCIMIDILRQYLFRAIGLKKLI
ncbi:acyltransferase [Ornithinibacillus xuwenensis]|uniref:Acyltransferase family protein n=1 Tax=Ornithinibacillus xuwenensis TaxID=3144668 RepID=A0ABU9XJP0_9BACI